MTSKDRTLVNRVLRLFMVELRAIFKRCSKPYYKRFPKAGRPCLTCAFNPSTDSWQGWDKTSYGLMCSIRDDNPFYCHENIPWKTPVKDWTLEQHKHFIENRKLCSGWAVAYSDPAAKMAFIKAATKAQGLDLASCAIPGAGELMK